jgi:hypothetical protein
VATITYDQDAPGRGGSGPVFSVGSGRQKVVTGSFSFDASYPTGGEVITEIFDLFNTGGGVSRLTGMVVESPISSAGTGKHSRIDFTAKKWMLYTNAATPAEVANASDQSGAVSLRFIAWGPR